jgi:hypothetical protein
VKNNNLEYLDIIRTILKDKMVNDNIRLLIEATKEDSLATNYFGINYTKDDFKSFKIYYSIASFFPMGLLKGFGLSDENIELIKRYWKPTDSLSYFHQGITLGLKCYIQSGEVVVNKYFHFRTDELVQKPKKLSLGAEDSLLPGICVEFHNNLDELKYYYYINSKENIDLLISSFKIEELINSEDIKCIEYTESEIERKINIVTTSTNSIAKCINNSNIFELSEYLFKDHKLYYSAPGFRYMSDVRALYFFPKKILYNTEPFSSFTDFFYNLD